MKDYLLITQESQQIKSGCINVQKTVKYQSSTISKLSITAFHSSWWLIIHPGELFVILKIILSRRNYVEKSH